MNHNLNNKTIWITGGKRIDQSVAEKFSGQIMFCPFKRFDLSTRSGSFVIDQVVEVPIAYSIIPKGDFRNFHYLV